MLAKVSEKAGKSESKFEGSTASQTEILAGMT